jgi:serine/threonine-protein kinase HipA
MDAKKVKSVKIFKNEIEAAELRRTKEGCELHFTSDYLKNNLRSPFTYQIAVQRESIKFIGVGLPTYFAGLLPEGLRLKALVRRIKTSEDDLFSLLVASGAEPVGDLHFAWQEQSKKNKAVEKKELPDDFDWLQKQMKLGLDPAENSLAGVQNKISADRISLPLRLKNKNKSYILKLASNDFPNIIQNEKICLEIAKKCGLQVNTARIVNDKAGREALLVERFDRGWNSNKKSIERYHQEDACQFLNRYPSDKYIISLQEVAEGLRQFCESPEIEILNLLKQKAFSYLIGNGDFHAKNISLLQAGADSISRLSPTYDLVCTALYGDLKMALQMDGKNQNLKRKNFLTFGERYQVPKIAIESMLDRLLINFKKSKELLFQFPLAQKKEIFLNQLFIERAKHLAD